MVEAYELLHGCIFARPTLTCWVRGIVTDRKNSTRDAKLQGYTYYIDFVVRQVGSFPSTIYYLFIFSVIRIETLMNSYNKPLV